MFKRWPTSSAKAGIKRMKSEVHTGMLALVVYTSP